MKIFIQTGHHSSFSKNIIELLYQNGLERPSKTYSKNSTVEDLILSLVEVINADSILTEQLANTLRNDILISNHRKDLWGWEIPQNIEILNYWNETVPNTKFALIFDHPRFLFDTSKDQWDSEYIIEILNNWKEYNVKLLKFYEENKESCILLEGVSVLEKRPELINVLSCFLHDNGAFDNKFIKKESMNSNNNLSDIFISEIVKLFPDIYETFNTLLEQADLKVSMEINHNKLQLEDLINICNQLKYENIKNEKIRNEKASKNTVDSNGEELKNILLKNNLVNNENKILIEQLQKVQQKFEDLYIKDMDTTSKTETNVIEYFDGEELIKQDLPYRLGATVIKNSRNIKDIMRIPNLLVREYQSFGKDKNLQRSLKQIEKCTDIDKMNVAKQHLSFLIGTEIVEVIDNPKSMFTAPLRISKKIVTFKIKKAIVN